MAENGNCRHYRIRVQGWLDVNWADWFDGMLIQNLTDGDGVTSTLLSGDIPDQAALYGLLKRLRDLGLTLLSIESARVPPDQ